MKEKMKKVLSMLLTVTLTAGVAISGTVAYLTSEDSDLNVMTLGKVKIQQHEYQRATDEAGKYKIDTIDNMDSYVLEGFEQAKPLLPATDPSNYGAGVWDSTTVRMSQVDSYGGMQVFVNPNAQDKFVTVENTGKTDAYVRTLVAVECGSTDGSLVGTSYHGNWDKNPIGIITIDGNKYYLIEYTYEGASDNSRHVGGVLPAGETSYPNLSQVYIKSEATNEDMEKIDGNGNGTLDILVLSQAVQADGFSGAQIALDTAFGKITTENHPWVDAVVTNEIGITEAGTYNLSGGVYTIDSAYFHTQKATDAVTINGNGATVEGVASSADAFQWEGGTIPAMSAIFSSSNGSKVTVNDLKFTGTMSSIMLGNYVSATYDNFDTELNNVDVIGTEVVSFSSNIAPAVCVYGKAVLNNCNIYGTTLSELDTDPKWPVYDLALCNYTTTTLKNSKVGSIYMWNQAKLTIEGNSEVDSILVLDKVNAHNFAITVKGGSTVGQIDLSKIAAQYEDYVNITIEDGATVGAFVDNGVPYDTLGDWKTANN